jgi:hypothetical protein
MEHPLEVLARNANAAITDLERRDPVLVKPGSYENVDRVHRIFHCVVHQVLGYDLEGCGVRREYETRIDVDLDRSPHHIVTGGYGLGAPIQKIPHSHIAEGDPYPLLDEPARLKDVIDKRRESVHVFEHHSPQCFSLFLRDLGPFEGL